MTDNLDPIYYRDIHHNADTPQSGPKHRRGGCVPCVIPRSIVSNSRGVKILILDDAIRLDACYQNAERAEASDLDP